MPPTRRKPTQSSSSSRAQKPLSFGPSNKITKPSISHTTAKSTKKDSPLRKAVVKEIDVITTPEPEEISQDERDSKKTQDALKSPGAEQRDLAIRKQQILSQLQQPEPKSAHALPKDHGDDVPDPTDEKARKVSDAAIKKYWQAVEDQRKAPRVHQQTLPLSQKILRHFDLSSQYGPCIGIPRLRRWKRADKLGLKPPIEVLSVLLKERETGEREVQRAYVDELMANRWEMEP